MLSRALRFDSGPEVSRPSGERWPGAERFALQITTPQAPEPREGEGRPQAIRTEIDEAGRQTPQARPRSCRSINRNADARTFGILDVRFYADRLTS